MTGRARKLVAAIGITSMVLAGVGTADASAKAPATWQHYLLTPPLHPTPVKVLSVSGAVTNAAALVTGTGVATLTATSSGKRPQIVLDYGQELGGIPDFTVRAVTGNDGAPVQLHAAFSETRQYLFTTGAATGDYTPSGPGNAVDVSVDKRGTYTARRVGGFRYQEIELDSPGTIRLTRAGITFDAYRAAESTYQGHFLSSSTQLNKLYYAGAYSTQLNMLPASTTGANPTGGPQLLDGAKRDQRIWSGDLLAEIATMESTLGSNAAPYIKSDLHYLIDNADPNTGELASVGQFLYYSLSYSIDTALAAVEYYRYSADTAFAGYALPALRQELGYLSQHIDDNGLLVTTGNGFEGMDWAFDNGPSVGEVSYFNMLYYHLLTEMNYLESHVGSSAQAAADLRLAAALRTRINDKLYSPSLKSYAYTDAKSDVIPQCQQRLKIDPLAAVEN